MSEALPNDELSNIHSRLMARSYGLTNDDALACMLASQCVGNGSLIPRLGLSVDDYDVMKQTHFPGVELPIDYMAEAKTDELRFDEQDELRTLFLSHRVDPGPEAQWITDILVAGSMGGNHLWQDLGLWNRKDLTTLISTNFPELAEKNDRDMKWKKFFYKQLCAQEGIYTCRSPSCEVCPDYKDCFSTED